MLAYHKVSLCTLQHYLTKVLFIAIFVAAEMKNVHSEAEPSNSKTYDIRMKGAKPKEVDTYLCTEYPLSEQRSYIYKFEALANATTVHHMILYGCTGGPSRSKDSVWSCGSICKEGRHTIVFSWAKNAPLTVLPKGVGFRIGKDSTVTTLVLQVHYAKAFKKEENADQSGLRIYTTNEEQPFVAGIFLMGAGGFKIPKGNPSYPVDISCDFNMEQSIFPFAYRPHAHNLGRVITGYLYNGSYYEIGKGNPKWPQAFYPIHNKIEVKPGNSLAARCTYDSTSMDHAVRVGSTGNDEMCNFYIMFYTDKSVVDPSGECWDDNKPELTGKSFPPDVSVPLPPNPELEEDAKGSHHHASSIGMVTSEPQDLNTTVSDTWTMDLLMKGAHPDQLDAYLCAAYPVTDEEAYIYKFDALADASTVHHILVYGCDGEPFSDQPIWQCPPMCKGFKSTIMFAWAKNAPPTVLPKDVGLRIGRRSPIKTIVLQVHYGKSFSAGEPPDHSGIRIHITQKKQPFVAGIYFLGSSYFSIPPGQSSYPVDVSCYFNMPESIFPIAYRTHAHGLGRVITGYQYNGTYHQIGKGNPQWPQAFYPVKDKIEVKRGDILAARCTYNSTSMSNTVKVGSTGNDEMCNFYIMFYTNSSVEDPSGTCNDDEISSLTGDHFPQDVSVPLPPNPELEEAAKGHHHNNHEDADSEVQPTLPADVLTQDLLMLGAKPDKPEAYLCSAYPVTEMESYILKFEAIANVSTVHHILLYGCDGEPFSSEPFWNCPPVCKDGKMSIMFAWAKNAPPTVFPQGVGMRIGQQSLITTIVLQVHYARAFAADEPADHSGVRIYTTKEKQPFVAGIYLMASDTFTIPPGNPSYPVDISCEFRRKSSIFPFMYRTHAHSLGKVITGYLYNGSYYEIGKGNPHWPQAFYPVKSKIEVKPGDHLAARCTYDSTSLDHTVGVGPHGDDEMCNLYIMFYTDSSETNPYAECVSNSEPQLTGDNFPSDVSLPLPPNPALEEEAQGHHHQAAGGAGDPDENNIHFEHKLEFNSSWPSEKVVLGQIGGVATDKDGNVYIFHRGSREWTAQSFSFDDDFRDQKSPIPEDVIVVLNSQGQLVRKFGAGQYFMPHGIEVDKDGNIWLTDVALHQVFKISHGETTPSLVLGHRFQHGSDLTSFCKPTDVAVLSSGEFFVSDGYCNGRVLKFSQNGTLIKAWGERQLLTDNSPPIGTFDISHSITVSEENQLVCVADRENGRVQCFDLDGNFKHLIKHREFGNRLFAIEQSAAQGGVLYAVNGPSFSGPSDISVQGFTLDIKTGDLLETWDIPQHLHNPHDLCVHTGSRSVYVGELNPQAVWKLSRQSTAESNTPVHVHIIKKPIGSVQTGNKAEESTTASDKKEGEAPKVASATAQNKTSLVASKDTESEKSDITPAVLIGCLLVVPVILLLIIILLVRARHSGKLNCCGHSKKRVFSLQGILGNSHKGFDPLNTEESDRDSDNEEYMAPKKIKNKS